MQEIILDFAGIQSPEALHDYLQAVFQLPGYYGRNLDALWDCLYCAFSQPTTIVLRRAAQLPADMAPTARGLLRLFDDLQREDENVTVRIDPEEKIVFRPSL